MSEKGGNTGDGKEEGGSGRPASPALQTDPASAGTGSTVVEKVTPGAKSDASASQQELNAERLSSLDLQVENLREELRQTDAATRNRVTVIEEYLGTLHSRCTALERLAYEGERKRAAFEENLLQIRRRVEGTEVEKVEEKWSEQFANKETGHQEELLKMHRQHHQDMLSVISDCCRKLKSGFTRLDPPYTVDEIHAVIDDTQQKMVKEILSEIQKTNNHEDLTSLDEGLATVKKTAATECIRDAGDDGARDRLTSENIASAIGTFESDSFGGWSPDLQPDFDGSYGAPEELISRNRAMITGDRGNLYYAEELKKTVDDLITSGEKSDQKKKVAQRNLPSDSFNYNELEKNLESMIVDDDGLVTAPVLDTEAEEKAYADKMADAKLDELWLKDRTTDWPPETSSMDVSQLKSFEEMLAADTSSVWKGDLRPATSTRDVDLLPSIDTMIADDIGDTRNVQPAISTRDLDQLKSLESTIEDEMMNSPPKAGGVLAATSTRDIDQLKSLEGIIEADSSQKAAVKPATSTRDLDQLMSLEAMIETESRQKAAVKPATSTRDLDQMKSLETAIEESMFQGPTHPTGQASKQSPEKPLRNTSANKQQVKASVSPLVTGSSAAPADEVDAKTLAQGTGGHGNPHYTREVLKDPPKETPKKEKH